MSSNTFETGVSDYEYRQRIRRYTPSSLLPLIAATAARYRTQQEWLNSPYRIFTPWALADVARVALTCGTEFGRLDAAGQDLLRILDAYNRFDDPFRRDRDLRAFLLRMAGEQLTWQASDYETLARTAAIFSQTAPAKPMECLQPGWDTELFGCSLREYVGTAQLVWANAFGCAGHFDLALFDTPDGQVIARHVGRDTATRVLDAQFAISKDQFRAEDDKVAQRSFGLDPRLRRFTYNPLRGRPVLTAGGRGRRGHCGRRQSNIPDERSRGPGAIRVGTRRAGRTIHTGSCRLPRCASRTERGESAYAQGQGWSRED